MKNMSPANVRREGVRENAQQVETTTGVPESSCIMIIWQGFLDANNPIKNKLAKNIRILNWLKMKEEKWGGIKVKLRNKEQPLSVSTVGICEPDGKLWVISCIWLLSYIQKYFSLLPLPFPPHIFCWSRNSWRSQSILGHPALGIVHAHH